MWLRSPDARNTLLDDLAKAWRHDLVQDGLDEPSIAKRLQRSDSLLREAPAGTKLLLKDKSIVEILENPGDGGWVRVRYLETSSAGVAVGNEEWVFYPDVQDFAQEM